MILVNIALNLIEWILSNPFCWINRDCSACRRFVVDVAMEEDCFRLFLTSQELFSYQRIDVRWRRNTIVIICRISVKLSPTTNFFLFPQL
jgi:hypothetical protein